MLSIYKCTPDVLDKFAEYIRPFLAEETTYDAYEELRLLNVFKEQLKSREYHTRVFTTGVHSEIHFALGMLLRGLPLYINNKSLLLQAISRWRLKEGV